ncbi:hypothetical protein BN59_01861 [Legionella massiliensis]|uniref:Uncharacterized protein n=1 Tax=Legionella massiliensis TaxID=1034943 RepID=A0A078KX16_9GAMM|nr:hypothetical protein [Legionella massiliensis]CDZ77577.1 hypothetical protein BN59_01861 [Legionella massiliensis]CEE13315.1 hypothetical protein BN1094_01861 [Legionella massiliensis]
MLTYRGKELTKTKAKTAGKNQSDVDGFYKNSDGEEFFIKKPANLKELFAELFAGLILEEFKTRGLIDKIYHDSLICADLIQFEDGSYGLIQPKVSFTELYKIIGTGYRNGSDRDPITEMLLGPRYYILLTQTGQYFGLASALMFSLLLGDYSVHSGNMVCLHALAGAEKKVTQFARIDWGAAFRYFGHPNNNLDLLYPFEYQGWFNLKAYTKGYMLNYKLITGLFPAIAEQAKFLQSHLDESLLQEIVSAALHKIPADFMDKKTQTELASYLCIDSFNSVDFAARNYQPFLKDMAEVLHTRLQKIANLQEIYSLPPESKRMFEEHLPAALLLKANPKLSFTEQLQHWQDLLKLSDEIDGFDFNTIELAILTKQFNYFIESLLVKLEQLSDKPELENNILRKIFAVKADASPCYTPSKGEGKALSSDAKNISAVLTAGFGVLVTLRVIQDTQNGDPSTVDKESAIHFLFKALMECVDTFHSAYEDVLRQIEQVESNKKIAKDSFFNKPDTRSRPDIHSELGHFGA